MGTRKGQQPASRALAADRRDRAAGAGGRAGRTRSAAPVDGRVDAEPARTPVRGDAALPMAGERATGSSHRCEAYFPATIIPGIHAVMSGLSLTL